MIPDNPDELRELLGRLRRRELRAEDWSVLKSISLDLSAQMASKGETTATFEVGEEVDSPDEAE